VPLAVEHAPGREARDAPSALARRRLRERRGGPASLRGTDASVDSTARSVQNDDRMGGDAGERGLRLLEDVAQAACGAHTREGIARRVAEALGRHLPLAGLEIRPGAAKGPSRPDERFLALAGPDGSPVVATLRVAPGSDPALLTPALEDALARVLSLALRNCALVERVADLSRRASVEAALVARSERMRAAVERVDLVAPTDTPVLLRGETGTGKELLARRVHRLSRRSGGPFVVVNCGALPASLVESELFGHEKGAFTGAAARRLGRFERASGGTLFLDEVGELSLDAQVKLLRALQEGEVERLGGDRAIAVDVRIVAATHRPLEAMVEGGAFRADLYYRLNVFPVVVPPLRERPEDLEPLVEHLLARAAARLGRRIPRVPPAALARLAGYAWPGNARELANVLERALILSRGDELKLDDWPPARVGAPPPAPAGGTADRPARDGSFADALRRTIAQALAACDGRIYGASGAAARLGLKPSTLQSKMKRLGIERETPAARRRGEA